MDALVIPPDRLRALLIAEAELGERIMRALILRRVGLIEVSAGGPVIIGPRRQPATCCGWQNSFAATAIRYQQLDPETDTAANPR